MVEKLTVEEHVARAMLLGLVYAANTHCYYRNNGSKTKRIDADTLEPVSSIQAYERYLVWKEKYGDPNIAREANR